MTGEYFQLRNTDKDNERAKEEGADIVGHHDTNLFDQNESVLGAERVDLGTGKPIDNTLPDGADHAALQEIVPIERQRDVLPPLKKKLDAAERWLRENDPNYRNEK